MIALSGWLPLGAVSVSFTTVGILKVYGFRKGTVGGAGRPASCRLLGSCPSLSRHLNIILVALFLGVGLACLGILLMPLLKS
jgi:hypothetical protein